ncbi:hypothetical protein GCM10029964_041340 [Kibdelosporangium lantanae]
MVAVADLLPERAEAVAEQYRGVRGVSVDDLLDATDVDLVLNLTIPAAHGEVALAALGAGKHVYGEKPLAHHCGGSGGSYVGRAEGVTGWLRT